MTIGYKGVSMAGTLNLWRGDSRKDADEIGYLKTVYFSKKQRAEIYVKALGKGPNFTLEHIEGHKYQLFRLEGTEKVLLADMDINRTAGSQCVVSVQPGTDVGFAVGLGALVSSVGLVAPVDVGGIVSVNTSSGCCCTIS